MDQFDAVYARMLFVSGKRTQSELAELLNLQQGSISEAKKRGIIPLSWCVRVSDLFHVRMDWLRFGEPPVFMSSVRQEYPARDEGVSGFRQPPPPPLERTRPGELPVYGTVRSADGAFPVVDRQIFPLEFTRRGVEIFWVLESCMAPALNAGALVAVLREAEAETGALVAVLGAADCSSAGCSSRPRVMNFAPNAARKVKKQGWCRKKTGRTFIMEGPSGPSSPFNG